MATAERLMFGWFYGLPAVELIPDKRSDRKVRLLRSFTFVLRRPQTHITVPEGFTFDGASIPRWLWPIMGHPLMGRYRNAAIIHDYLYWLGRRAGRPRFDRKKSDRIFFAAMRANGVGHERALLMYWAVRLFGPRFPKRKEAR